MHDERHLALIDADRRSLVRAATRLLGAADAEDAVQDAYVRTLEADTLKLNAAQAWLLTVVRHLAVDQLRRRHWMQQWLAQTSAGGAAMASPSAEADAAVAEEAARALRLLAAQLTPADGAAVLLHEVFEVGHAEIARAGGRSEASSRQQLRRALVRLRQARGTPEPGPPVELEPSEETVFRAYLQSLQGRDPQTLWAMLRQSPVRGLTGLCKAAGVAAAASTPSATACGVMEVGGQFGLVLTLDGVTLCVVPLGVQPAHNSETALP